MRQIREVLRQKWGLGLSNRQIARGCGLSRPTVAKYLRRAKAAGFSWPLPAVLDDAELERKLFPPVVAIPAEQRTVPDWSVVNQEFKRKGVTLALLWDEYKEANPEGFQYSWFSEHYRCWLGKVDVVMRQTHRAGPSCWYCPPPSPC
ncbi:MAG: winged helix-turn-helix transcriptional regulator [Proteobacteria bacterium]|nr:winged helix-turn-helix transcriptional regulator [Pseudomonadota bacterium]